MQIKCVHTSISEIAMNADQQLVTYLKDSISNSDGLYGYLEKNVIYNVYGIDYGHNCSWVFICENQDDNYPMAYPFPFFKIIDSHISKYWECGLSYDGNIFLTFKEWLRDDMFYENLLNDSPKELEIFVKYKRLIDMEFPDQTLKTANIIHDNWIMCFYCEEAWEADNGLGVIRCPKCFKFQNNPLYNAGVGEHEVPSTKIE